MASLGSVGLTSPPVGRITSPSLDDVIVVLLACSCRRVLGPDVIPIEVVIVGGLLVVKLLHGLVGASWAQR